jgi:phosphinothricin acetyltransferase
MITMEQISIRTFEKTDFSSVKEIYQQGIDTKNATFEAVAPDYEEWNKKFVQHSRLVAVENNMIAGWAALSQVSARAVYSGVLEVSVYVHAEQRGKGTGRALLEALIASSEQNGAWTLQAGIFPENQASIRMHKEAGFREVGYREKIGMMDGKWRDAVLLERRSKITGI